MQIKLIGWAVSNDREASVKVYLDGNQISNVIRSSRPDVDSAVSSSYGGTSNTPKAGFETNIDISNISKGNHIIKVEETSQFGQILSSRTNKYKYSG